MQNKTKIPFACQTYHLNPPVMLSKNG